MPKSSFETAKVCVYCLQPIYKKTKKEYKISKKQEIRDISMRVN